MLTARRESSLWFIRKQPKRKKMKETLESFVFVRHFSERKKIGLPELAKSKKREKGVQMLKVFSRRLSPKTDRISVAPLKQPKKSIATKHVTKPTAADVAAKIEACTIHDAYSQLQLSSFKDARNEGVAVFRGQCFMRRGSTWQSFEFALFENMICFQGSSSAVTGYIGLDNVGTVLKGGSGDQVFVALCNSDGLEVVMLFDQFDESCAQRLYVQLCSVV